MDISIKISYKNEGLQKLRKAAGLSQSQLANKAGSVCRCSNSTSRASGI